ncbi:uncharacterized protein [Porites lutea]|uniref:uncharacterized protein n=1 Tax=Porites lutea TaxID=51062 RepID=UPI003CC6B19F
MDQRAKLKGITSKKERRLSQNADVLGVCLVAKHAARSSTGRHTGLRTGSVVRGLHEYSKKKIFVVTSEKIVREEELDDLKRRKNVLNASDYTLYFLSSSDPHSHSEPPKMYQLQDVTNLIDSEEKVIFNSGLVIIPIASEKLSENSGLKIYRPFAASTEETELKDLNGSICQIVEGSTKSIDVKSYKIEFIDNECALSLPEKETTHRYKNWTELTAGGAITNLHPYGAVILKSGRAVAVLNFVDDKISPVCLSEVQFSEATSRKNSLPEGTKESKKKDDISSDTKLSKQTVCLDLNSDAESRKSSLAEGESRNGDAISPVITTNDGKSSRDGKPDQSESANGVEAQLGGSRAGCIKKIDPYKGTGAIPKRPKQGNSSKPETSSSKETLAEETDESKEKSDIFSKGEIIPVQESAGLIEGSQDADEAAGESGADWKAPTESSETSLLKGESKKEDAITARRALDGKLSRDGKPDQSESSNGVEAQLGGSRAGCIKEIDPYKGTGAIPKRPKQGNSSKPETSSSKETLAEGTNESKKKDDIPSKDEIIPIQESTGSIEGVEEADELAGERGADCKALTESSKSSLPKVGSRKEDAIFSGRRTMFGEIPGQGGSKRAIPTRNNGACASPYKGKGKQPRHENKVSVENGKLRVALEELSVTGQSVERHDVGRLDNNDNAKGTQDDAKKPVENEDLQNGTEVTVEAQANGRDEGDNNSDGIRPSGAMAGNRATPTIEGQESQIRRRKSETPPDSPTSKSDICKPIISGVAFRWHFLILVQAVGVN